MTTTFSKPFYEQMQITLQTLNSLECYILYVQPRRPTSGPGLDVGIQSRFEPSPYSARNLQPNPSANVIVFHTLIAKYRQI